MAKRNVYLIVLALVVFLGVPTFLLLGFVYGTLSPRGWAIGLVVWVATGGLWTVVAKGLTKKTLAPSPNPASALDDNARKRVMREIWLGKAWIGILVVLFPFGIANGIAHRAWISTIVGGAISLLWMYVTAQKISRSQQRINVIRQ